jgi:hypothetical protein
MRLGGHQITATVQVELVARLRVSTVMPTWLRPGCLAQTAVGIFWTGLALCVRPLAICFGGNTIAVFVAKPMRGSRCSGQTGQGTYASNEQ